MTHADYENRLKIPVIGDTSTNFYTLSGLKIANGYNRIVIGGRGPYVEFDELIFENLHIPEQEEYRIKNDTVCYVEFRTNDGCNVKVYFQKKRVDYADYLAGKYYVSPFELMTDEVPVIIEKVDIKKVWETINKFY